MTSMQQAQFPFDRSEAAATRPRTHFRRANAQRPQATDDARAFLSTPSDADLTGGVANSVERAPLLLTVRDVEQELQLGRTRTYELIRSGEIPVTRIGRSVRVPRDALRRWIEAHTT